MSLKNKISKGCAWFKSHALPSNENDLKKMEHAIMAKLTTLKEQLDALNAQLEKAKGEIVAEIEALKGALSDVDIPEEAQASLDKLAGLAQSLDELNPDAPPQPEPPA